MSIDPPKKKIFENFLKNKSNYTLLGEVSNGKIVIDDMDFGNIEVVKQDYLNSIENILESWFVSVLETKIEFLKGVGPKRAALLNTELSIFNFYDLLTFFPFRYIDRSKVYKISQIKNFDIDFQLIGTVERLSLIHISEPTRRM